jgi:hypothetical protein
MKQNEVHYSYFFYMQCEMHSLTYISLRGHEVLIKQNKYLLNN